MPLAKRLSPLKQSQQWLAEIVKPHDEVVDATIGNGYDTLFLINCLRDEDSTIKGFLWGFDVQEQALESTQGKLNQADVANDCYSLHLASHAQLASIVPSRQLAVVMFNLGYLPGADKSIITKTQETMQALKMALMKLKVGGVLSIMCYPGHEGGDVESATVTAWVDALDSEQFLIKRVDSEFVTTKSAFLLWVQKIHENN